MKNEGIRKSAKVNYRGETMTKRNIELIWQLTKREISEKYKGSYMGVLWFVVQPILLLIVYTFVFSSVFKARWGDVDTSQVEYALILFAGITTYNILSDIVTRSPYLILSHSNYVKKVVFPLEILPIVLTLSSLFFNGISYLILIIGVSIIKAQFIWSTVLLPVVILPMVIIALGLSWFISSLGVYFRDVNQIVTVAFTALMFLSPVFYPITSVPEDMLFLYDMNPLSYVIENVRNVLIWGETPEYSSFMIELFVSVVVAFLGFLFMKKTKGGFADVL